MNQHRHHRGQAAIEPDPDLAWFENLVFEVTHSYAALLAKEGITVNAIAPALIGTEMIENNPKARPDVIPVGL